MPSTEDEGGANPPASGSCMCDNFAYFSTGTIFERRVADSLHARQPQAMDKCLAVANDASSALNLDAFYLMQPLMGKTFSLRCT